MDSFRKTRIRETHAVYDAILKADVSAAERLINLSDACLNEKTEEGWTPLHVAVIYSTDDRLTHLVARSTVTSVNDKEGKSPLHWAAYRNVSFDIFSRLVSVMPDELNRKDRYGRTPLHYVCLKDATCKEAYEKKDCNNHDLILKLDLLLGRMEQIDIPDSEGNTPLLVLCANMHNFVHSDEVNLDLHTDDLKLFRSKSICGLMLEMILNRGANYEIQNKYGMTALHVACYSVCVEMVRLLLSRDPVPRLTLDAGGNTPMTLIFTSVSSCLAKKYKVQPSNWFPVSDLQSRFHDTLRPVLKCWKTAVNIQKKVSGFTVLFYAVSETLCHSNVVKGLIGYGKADVNHRTFAGKTPLHYAVRPEVVVPSTLREAIAENWREKVDLLIQNGASINAQDLFGCTPLHDATLFGDLKLAELLMDNKADVNLINKCGATPLQLLCLNTDVFEILDSLVDRLIKEGADVNCQDVSGSTALHYAIYSGNKAMIIKLLEKGADRHIKDRNGLNAQEYCRTIGRMTLINCLSEEKSLEKQIGYEFRSDKADCFMMPIRVKQIRTWLLSNMPKIKLPDEKISDLIQSSNTDRLSNCVEANTVLKQLLNLMKATFEEVERLDSRFKITIELSGSTREGTKVGDPDEFDLLCFLDSFDNICDFEEYDSKFIRCRLKAGKDSHLFQSLFDDNNFLLGNRLTTSLYLCIRNAMSRSSVWVSAPGLSMDRSLDDYPREQDMSGIRCLYFRFSDGRYKDLAISCDIVPAIRKKHWWPSFARQEGQLMSTKIKENGCMVIAKPYLEVALSGERVRMLTYFNASVYLSECSVLLSIPKFVLDAYKLAKILLKKKNLYPPLQEDPDPEVLYRRIKEEEPDFGVTTQHPAMSVTIITSYMLKNALFYELDSELPNSVDDTCHISLTRQWTVRIFRRLQRLLENGSLPPYFLPNQSIIPPEHPRQNSMVGIACEFCKVIASVLNGNVSD